MLQLKPTVLNTLNRKEHYLFYAALLFHLAPLLVGPLFITLDGPAHLYNGSIIRDLLLNKSPLLSSTFEWQTGVLPNWTGHALIAALSSVLPAHVVEKLVQVLIISGLAFGWRRYILHLGGNAWLSYLIFPFLHSYFFTLGFYNFLIGIALLPFALVSCQRMLLSDAPWRHLAIMLVWFMLLYFSHLVVFGLALGIVGLLWLMSLVTLWRHAEGALRRVLLQAAVLLAAAALPMWWALRYFAERQDSSEPQYLDIAQLWQMIIDVRPLISFNYEREAALLVWFLVIIIALVLIGSVLSIRKPVHENQTHTTFRFRSFALLAAATLCMALYWLLPDMDTQAGYISSRMLYMFFLLLTMWLALQPFGKITSSAAAVSSLALSINLLSVNAVIYNDLPKKGKAFMEAGALIPAGSILLPINTPTNYLLGHTSNYLGAMSAGVLVLRNYEADNTYFPLRWNEAQMPHFQLLGSGPEAYPCTHWRSKPENETVPITHILYWEGIEGEEICTELQALLERPELQKIYASQGFSIWEIKGLE